MDTLRKKYRALRSFVYATNVVVRNKSRVITFDGGNRSSGEKGFFVTDDVEVQDALESLPLFNVDFYLEERFRYEKSGIPEVPPTRDVLIRQEAEPEDNDSTETKNPEGTEERPDEQEQPKEGSTNSYPDVTNAQSAKIIMLGLFPEENTRIAELRKADEVRQFANEKGISFPNWM